MFVKERFWEDISKAATIGIAGHIRPDGDCVGSCLGLAGYIKDNFGISAEVFLENFSPAFTFLRGSEDVIMTYPDRTEFDVFIVLDCGDMARVGKSDRYIEKAKIAYCIDHHGTNTGFLPNSLIEADAAATAEILCGLMDEEKISTDTAEALYLGMVHDTGVFKHSNTTRRTMELAGMLLEHGVSSSKVIDGSFYEKTYLQNQVLGRCLMESILCMDGKVIVASLDRKTQAFYQLEPSDTEGIIDQLRVTKGVEVAILLKEMNPRVWRVSMRSCEYVDVSVICSLFGGGGHVRAAGCILNGSLHDVINNLTKEIEKQIR